MGPTLLFIQEGVLGVGGGGGSGRVSASGGWKVDL